MSFSKLKISTQDNTGLLRSSTAHKVAGSDKPMEVGTHDEAEWHAVTDRYAQALREMQAGDLDARTALLAAYRQLQAIARLQPCELWFDA